MTALVLLPSHLDGAAVSCGTTYGKRTICWTITGPGEWHRNRFSIAWIEVTERTVWAGEPLTLWATRRPPDSLLARESFTDLARHRISAEVLPPVSRYGFGRLWLDLHRQGGRSDPERLDRQREVMLDQIRRAEAELEWHRLKSELHDMHVDGLTEFIPERDPRERRVAVVPRYRGESALAPVVVRVMVAGEQVGWMTDHGDLVPLDEVLS